MVREIPECTTCNVLAASCFSFMGLPELDDLKYEKSCSLYKKGQIIFQEDQRALGIYCLHDGIVKLFKTGYDGKEQIVRFVSPGELFGYQSIIGAKLYHVNSQALENAVACFFSNDAFFEIINRYPGLSRSLIIALSTMLNDAENKMTSMAHKPVRERLAEALLNLHAKYKSGNDPKNNSINLSREDLAKMIGSATETVIRLLSEFKDEQLIQIDGRRISLLNIKDISKVANLDRSVTLSYFKEPIE
jgi:CRP/FNR family transcriptional regulator, polysaccharide utilization system transcription regulator